MSSISFKAATKLLGFIIQSAKTTWGVNEQGEYLIENTTFTLAKGVRPFGAVAFNDN